jgi:hypothetical protein
LLFLPRDFCQEAAVTSLLTQPHLYVYFLELVRACVWLLILSLVFVPLEMLFPLHKERTFRATTLSDLGFHFVSTFLPPFVLLIPLTVAAAGRGRILADLGSPARRVRDGRPWLLLGPSLGPPIPLLGRFHSAHHDPKHVYFSDQRARPSDR